MLRYALLAAALTLSSPSFADKIVNPDGDSFVEVGETAPIVPDARAQATESGKSFAQTLIDGLLPSSAQAATSPPQAATSSQEPEPEIPLVDYNSEEWR
jgi:hypothetical protein